MACFGQAQPAGARVAFGTDSSGSSAGGDVAIALDPATTELYRDGSYHLDGEGRVLAAMSVSGHAARVSRAELEGRYLPAAYGGDPIRNPDSLPTGRNLTGLDPSRLPTRQAYAVAQTLFNDWFKDYQARHGGQAPERMALSLWAGETLRHQGIMEAQALVALGMRPVWDDAGRPVRVETIAADELKRPRVDVLMSITGSYRDQFPALMALLDRAVAQAATAEPGEPALDSSEPGRRTIWWKWTAPATASVTVDTDGSAIDTPAITALRWSLEDVGRAAALTPTARSETIIAAADIPIPKQIVETSGRTCCIAS